MYFISIGLNLLYNMINNAIIHSYSWCIHVLINACHLFFSAIKFGCTYYSVSKSLELKTNISILHIKGENNWDSDSKHKNKICKIISANLYL